jgi:tRNA(fMet)-specific endonuclease VapC
MRQIIADPDIIIAATVLTKNLILVTNNEKHYQRIDSLQRENWTK